MHSSTQYKLKVLKLKNTFTLLCSCIFLSTTLFSQIATTPNNNAQQLATLIGGNGIVVSNAVVTCPNGSIGTFNGSASNIGLADGVIMSTGDIGDAAPIGGILGGDASTSTGGGAYTPLEPLIRDDSFDRCLLEFDLEATSSQFEFEYVFASEEYLTYVGSSFNDAFAFFISGPGIAGTQNIGLVPGTTDPVTINTINPGVNPAFYIDNPNEPTVEYNGFTTVLKTAPVDVEPCSVYHLTLAIADGGDAILDAAVMIKANSLQSIGVDLTPPVVSGSLGAGLIYENCDSAIFRFELSTTLQNDYTFPISVKGSATNGVDYRFIPDSVVIKAGTNFAEVTILPITDLILDGGEDVEICVLDPCDFSEIICQTVIIEELNSTITEEQNLCYGDSTQLEATFNTNYEYSWTPTTGLSCTDCHNPMAGPRDSTLYTVEISDKTCSIFREVQVNVAAEALPVLVDTAACIGTITATYTVETPSFDTYTWTPNTTGISSTSNSTVFFTVIDSTVTYTVEAENEHGCLLYEDITITAYPDVEADFTTTDILCFGDSTGQIVVNVTSPTPIDSFIWSDGYLGNPYNNIPEGNYDLRVVDIYGCFLDMDTTLYQPDAPLETEAYELVAVYCNGNDGQTEATITGGTTPYTFSWSPMGGNSLQSTPDLTVGIYTFSVTDANNCFVSDTAEVTTYGGQKDATINPIGPFCATASDVPLTAAMPGGEWKINGTVITDSTFSPSALGSGNHEVTYFLDAGLCSDRDTITVLVNSQFQADINPIADICELNSDTSLTSVTPGGLWWGTGMIGMATDSTSSVFSPSTAGGGTHTIYHLIGGSCGELDSLDITVIAADIAAITPPIDFCPTGTAAQLNATPAGGTWSGTGIDPSGIFIPGTVGTGDYTVTYTPAGNCFVIDQAQVRVVDTVKASGMTVAVSCFGDMTATVNTTATGEALPLNYSWDHDASLTTANASGLGAGTYNVTVTDNLGCSATTTHTVTEPTQLVYSQPLTSNDATCFGVSNGDIEVFPSGGTAPYTTFITPNAGTVNGNKIINLPANTYTITTQDDNGCTITDNVTIQEPADINISGTPYTAYCLQPNGGVSSVTVTGGTAPYTYSWSNGTSNINLSNAVPGNYKLVITDNQMCQDSSTFTVPNSGGADLSMGTFDVTCKNGTDGVAFVNVSGGTPPYTFAWPGYSSSTDTLKNIPAGDYFVSVTDATNCTTKDTITVIEPTMVVATQESGSTMCDGQTFTTTLLATGGNGGPYTFEVNGISQPNGDFSTNDQVNTNYNVIAYDSKGCPSDIMSFVVDYLPPIVATVSPSQTVCPGEDAQISASATGGLGSFTYNWSNGSMGTPITVSTTAGVNNQTIYVVASDGCSRNDTVETDINLFPLPIMDPTAVPPNGCVPLTPHFSLTDANYQEVSWNMGDNVTIDNQYEFDYVYSKSGTYTVTLTATSEDGCPVTGQLPYLVEAYPIPTGGIVQEPDPITIVNPIGNFKLNTVYNIDSIVWNLTHDTTLLLNTNKKTFQYIFPEEVEDYNLHALFISDKGCVNETDYLVKVLDDYLFMLPNTFTPNGDGTNDIFQANWLGLNPEFFQIIIVNRWGREVFSSSDPNFQWDGSINGEFVKEDTYMWKVNMYSRETKKKAIYGHVNVLR